MSDINADEEVELRRLRWRSRRGMRELDQLFERYLDQAWRKASEGERGVFLRLLESEDDKLWRWFMGYEAPVDAEFETLVRRISSLPH